MIRILDYKDAARAAHPQDAAPGRSRARGGADSRRRPPSRRRGPARICAQVRRLRGRERSHCPLQERSSRNSRRAVRIAAANIREYARLQLPQERFVEYADGRRLGQIVRPLDSMGAYTPAGRYPLPSTLLMNVIPAQVAGVENDLRGVPPAQPGNPGHRGLARRHASLSNGRCAGHRGAGLSGRKLSRASTASWAPATSMSPPQRNSSRARPESTSSPDQPRSSSSRPRATPRWIAADMLAQAEHDVDASAILLTTSRSAGRSRGAGDRASTRNAAHRRASHARQSTRTEPSSLWMRWNEPSSFPTLSRRNISRCTNSNSWHRFKTQDRCSWVQRVRRPPATMPLARITFFPRPARPACAEVFRRPIS